MKYDFRISKKNTRTKESAARNEKLKPEEKMESSKSANNEYANSL